MSPACRLCGSTGTVPLDVLAPENLEREYRRQCGVRIILPVQPIEYRCCDQCGLRFFVPAEPGDDAFYATLGRLPWYYQDEKHEFALAARRIGPGHDVLEIGAGRGAFARGLRARSYCGLELSTAAIATAHASGLTLLRETVEEHAARRPAGYDVVCSFQVLEHVRDPRGFLEAASCCLRPGGRLVVSVPAEDSFMGADRFDVLNMPPHHLTRWTDRALAAVAGLVGLELIDVTHEPLAPGHARLYARVAAQSGFAALRGWAPRLLDARLTSPLAAGCVWLHASLIRRTLRLRRRRPAGHTVVAVYGKP